MNQKPEPIQLIKEACNMVQCDFNSRAALVDAVRAIEADLAELARRRAVDAPKEDAVQV